MTDHIQSAGTSSSSGSEARTGKRRPSRAAVGARAVPKLLRDLADLDDGASRDRLVASTLQRHLVDADPEHQRGFVLALAELLSIAADGCAPQEGWTPEACRG